MIIDFHTHVFPDKIAKRTIEHLSEKGGIPPFSDGSAGGLICDMEKNGIDISVTLPVLTSPAQFESVNRYAIELNLLYKDKKRRLISFAGIHPDCEDIEKKMKWIKESGFIGVKLHPDYQGHFINDAGYIKIVECAAELDLVVITHSGVDFGFPGEPVRSTPRLARELIKRVPHSKLVFAHMGANEMYDEVYEELAGENVYFDTAYVMRNISREKFTKILGKHGEDKILFASDSPWSDAGVDVDILRSYSDSEKTLEKILYKNAVRLLGIGDFYGI